MSERLPQIFQVRQAPLSDPDYPAGDQMQQLGFDFS
jgi:hypothetical protein